MNKLKIFDRDTQNYLRQAGVNEAEIDRIKHKELKEAVLSRLREIAIAIKEDRYSDVLDGDYLGFSPSGDCMGSENYFIHFAYLFEDRYGYDLHDVLTLLKDLYEK